MPNPNDLLTSTQGQTNTASNNGANRVAKFKAKSHFFLEDATYTQNQSQAFGIVSDQEFCTTARVSVTNKKVIAVCAGQVFIQPQSGPSADPAKVNVILKPYKQPVNGLAIKYFIYRGLPKSEFFDNAGKVKTTGSGLITYIRNEFASFYSNSSGTVPDFLGTFIGFPDAQSTQQETDLIDSYFYKVSQTFDNETAGTDPKLAYELPMIPAGTHMATANGEIGFDIVLSEGDYFTANDTNPFQLNLKFARAVKNTLTTTGITDPYQQKVLREACGLFIDPAAYYGIHANGGSIYQVGQTQAIESAANIAALIANFYTKNNIYLYIQSTRQRSYNFYGTHKISDTNLNNMKIGIAANGLTETTFETNKWPVTIFNTAPAAGSTQQSIVLQLTTDRGTRTALFGKLANITSANQEGFLDTSHLITPADANGALSYFTKPVVLSSPVNGNQNIASFAQLIYLGKSIVLSKPGIDDGDPNTPPPEPVLYTTKYMDDVFYLTRATSFLVADKVYHVHSNVPTLYSQQDIDKARNNVLAYTQRTQDVVQISDTQQLTLFTYLSVAEQEQSNHSSFFPNASANKEATGYSVQSGAPFYTLPNLPSNEYVTLSGFNDGDQADITDIKLKTRDGSLATTIVLGITEAQNTILKALLTNANNPRIYFEPFFENGNDLVSPENVKYSKYKLGILDDNATFKPQILLPAEPDTIIVYSTDKLIFYSETYSENVTGIIETLSVTPIEMKP